MQCLRVTHGTDNHFHLWPAARQRTCTSIAASAECTGRLSGTLWASDILSDTELPLVAHSLAAYDRTLNRLAALDLRALVPGHGTPSTDPAAIQTRLSEDRAYLAELGQRVARAVRQGLTPAETVAECADIPYRHPAENAGPHRLNVESAFLELGGEGDRRTLGWGQYE